MGSCASKKGKSLQVRNSIANMGTRIKLLDRFGATQAKLLLEIYNKHVTSAGLDIRSFQKMFLQLSEFPFAILESVFKIFDIDSTETVSFSNFCVTISQYLIGHRAEKCKFLFRVFDTNGNGVIEGKELILFKKYVKKVLRQNDVFYSREEAEVSIDSWKKLTLDELITWSLQYLDFHKALIPFEVIPSPNSEKEILRPLLSQPQLEHETWFLISTPWLDTWKNYVNFEKTEGNEVLSSLSLRSKSILPGSRPVEINNFEFQDPLCPEHIRSDFKYPEDCTPVPEAAWKELLSWYGGGPEFPRKVVKNQHGRLDIEWFPVVFKVHVTSKDLRTLMVSRMMKIEDVVKEISGEGNGRIYCIDGSELRVLENERIVGECVVERVLKCVFQDVGRDGETPLLKEFVEIGQEFEFCVGENVEYEEDGQWLSGFIKEIKEFEFMIGAGWRPKPVKILKTETFRIRKPSRLLITSSKIINATGLVNLGNTCYMNSILQCMNNTPLLSKFFALGSYLKLVNRKNTESSKGQVSRVFGGLLKNISSGSYGRVRPYEFYNTFAGIYTLFKGNEQQDAHEFLRILLDSLHEDLSRQEGEKTQKTITLNNPEPEIERQSSQDHWQKIQGNIGSVISDLCGGQSRNKISCKNCDSSVVIFELLMDLSLPIPIATPEVTVYIHFFKKTLEMCYKFKFNLMRNSSSQVFVGKILKETECKVEDLKFFVHRNKELFEISKETLDVHFASDIFVYEVMSRLEDVDRKVKIKKGSDWREKIVPGDWVDFDTGTGWVSGQVEEIFENEFGVFVEKNDGYVVKIEKMSSLLSPFRSHTLNGGSVFYTKLYHRRVINNEPDTFGLPLLVSLGTWFMFQDIRSLLEELTYEYSGINHIGDLVKFTVFTESSVCALCGSKSCLGCDLPSSFVSIQTLPLGFYLCLHWRSFIIYKPRLYEYQEMEDISIYKCLEEYSREENIEFNCTRCGNKDSVSKTTVKRLPDFLIIHLKRFRFEGNFPTKINNKIEFPLNSFDLNSIFLEANQSFDYTKSKAKDNNYYDLFAVVNHSGNVYGGHYTCTCLVDSRGQKKWLYYDDDHVYELQGNIENEIVTSKAYILFYRRQRMSSSSLIQLSN